MSKFRLARVLRVRELQADIARNEVAIARRAEVQAREELVVRAERYQASLNGAGSNSLDGLLAQRQHSDRLAAHQRRGEVEVQQHEVVVENRMEDWQRASRRVDGLERLEERFQENKALEARRYTEAELVDRVGRGDQNVIH
jgi:flagellar biosynthesis chaperone FliJ